MKCSFVLVILIWASLAFAKEQSPSDAPQKPAKNANAKHDKASKAGRPKSPGKKSKEVKPEPYAWVLPFLTVADVGKSIAFYKAVFGFETAYANKDKSGTIVHAEMKYRNKTVLLLTPQGMHPKTVKTPKNAKVESPTVIFLYIENVDAVYKKALQNGGKSIMKPHTVPWGERHCHFLDPDGHRWQLGALAKKKKLTEEASKKNGEQNKK